MGKKQPAYQIFRYLPIRVVAAIAATAKKNGWNKPKSGVRFYPATPLVKSIFVFYLKQMRSLEDLAMHLRDFSQVRGALGFGRYSPSKSTFSRFLRTLGSQPQEDLFYELVTILQEQGFLKGFHLAIDSTHVKAWSQRRSKDKTKQEFKEARNCDFALLGMTPKGFMLCYRVHVATLTRSEIPVAIHIVPGNRHDRAIFEEIFVKAVNQIPDPLAVSADKGYSSGKNRNIAQAASAACIIRPSKTDLKGSSLSKFIPKGMSEDTYWKVYWRRNAVERTFARTKGQLNLSRPRVVDEDPIKQHIFFSFILHQLLVFASAAMGLKKTSFSTFR